MIDNKTLAALKSLLKSGGGTGGGGTSIDVTAQVGQTIVVKEVDANGKPTAWESADYQPRTHWSEPVEVLPETTVEIDPEISAALLPDMAIVSGDKCTVKYNGTHYECDCIDDGDYGLYLGNFGILDEENPVDTGEPFIVIKTIIDEEGNVGFAVMPLDGSESITLSIIGQTHHAIPDKYLPIGNKIVDVKITILAEGNKYVVETDMEFATILAHALKPNTLVRGVISNGASNGFLNLKSANNSVIVFNGFESDTGNISINVQGIRLYSDGRKEYEYYRIYSRET